MTLRPETRLAGLTSLASVIPLLVARASQDFLALIPCELCLLERWPYRIALLLAALAALLPRRPARAMLWLAVPVLLAGAAIAALHVGVERGFWPSPLPECAAPDLHGMSPAERLAHLPSRPSKPCDQADYLIPGLPLSMTEMDLLYALGFSGMLAISLARRTGRRFS